MVYLIYVSSAVVPLSSEELSDLLARTREKNIRSGITGLLLYKDGNFMQMLEGEEATVRATYARIQRDPRHRGLLTLLQGPLAERQFPGWSMAFRNLNAADARTIPGYSEFLNTPLNGAEFSGNPSRAQSLLMTFKREM
jgi:hypothetical protein